MSGRPAVEVSVVVPTYNRSPTLLRALGSLAAMTVDPPLSWEIIVVDNNSKDDTRAVVEAFAATAPVSVAYVFEGTQGLNPARNRGVMESRGEIVAFIDDDVVVTRDWLVEVRRAFDVYGAACVGGRAILSDEVPRPAWWDPRFNGALGECDLGDAVIVADATYRGTVGIGANLSFRRSVFDKHGLFQIGLDRIGKKLLMGGDTQYYLRLKRAGELAIYYPRAVVFHCPQVERLTPRYLRRWYFRFGEWHSVIDDQILPQQRPVTVLGIPRTLLRSALVNGVRGFISVLRGRWTDAFYHETQLVSLAGYVCGVLKRSRA